MFKQRKRGDDDDDDDEDHPRQIRDGEAVRVPMFAMDAVQAAIARNGLHDGHGNHDAVGHRPGHICDASDVDGDERRRKMYDAYDAEKAREYLGPDRAEREYPAAAEGSVCTVAGHRYREFFGAPGHVIGGVCVPDELQRDALPARDGTTMTLDALEAQHRCNMADVYAAYDARIREMWRNP